MVLAALTPSRRAIRGHRGNFHRHCCRLGNTHMATSDQTHSATPGVLHQCSTIVTQLLHTLHAVRDIQQHSSNQNNWKPTTRQPQFSASTFAALHVSVPAPHCHCLPAPSVPHPA